TELDVHEARHPTSRVGVLVVLHALDEGTRTVPDAHDGYPYRTHEDCSFSSFLSACLLGRSPGWSSQRPSPVLAGLSAPFGVASPAGPPGSASAESAASARR